MDRLSVNHPHCELGDAWIRNLSGTERSERRIPVQLVEGADLVRAVDRTRADGLGSKVGMIEQVEIFRPRLGLAMVKTEYPRKLTESIASSLQSMLKT
jgi:hypothetical protein